MIQDILKNKAGMVVRLAGRILGGLVSAIVLALCAAVIVLPAAAGATPLTVLTGSMAPDLPPGTMIVVRPTAPEDIRVGDVVTYQAESGKPGLVTHRVVEVHSLSDGHFEFVTKGDANGAADPDVVVEEQIRGTVWYHVPLVGWLTTGFLAEHRAWLIPAAGVLLLGLAAVSFSVEAIGLLRRRTSSTGAEEHPLAAGSEVEAVVRAPELQRS